MLHLRGLNKILHCIYLTGFCRGSGYVRVLNMSDFIKKTLHQIDA